MNTKTTQHNTTQHNITQHNTTQIMMKFIITTPILLVVLIIVVVVATLVVTSASASASASASSTASRRAAIATSFSSSSISSISATATATATAAVNNNNNELMLLWAEKLLSRSSIRRDNNDSNDVEKQEEQEQRKDEAQLLRYLQISEDENENENEDENEDKDLYVNFLELLDPQKSDNSTVSNIIDQLKEYINGDGSAVNNLINQFLLPTANSSSGSEDDANDGDANSSNSSSSASAKISFNIPNGFLLDLGIGGSSVNLTSVTVGGLNTFTLINLLQPVTVSIDNNDNNDTTTTLPISTYDEYESPKTIIQNNFKMKELYLDLNLIETITTTTSGSTSESVVSMRLPFQNITMIALPLRLALSIEAIKQMPMGALLDYENYLMICLSTIIHEFELMEMDIEFGLVEYPIMLSINSNNTINRTSTPFFDAITALFIGLPIAVPIFFNTTIRNIINDLLYDSILDIDNDNDSSNTAVTCPSYPTIVEVNDSNDDESTDNLLIDYRTFFNEGLPLMIKDLIDSQLIANDSSTGLPKINNVVIEPFLGENMTFNGNSESNDDNSNYLLDTNGTIQLGGLDADYKFSIENIQIQNINTMIQPIEILQSIENEPYQLNNTITMGLALEEKPMSIVINKLYFAIITDEDGSIENEINIKMDMEAINVIVTMIIKIVESKLYGFQMENIMNIHCWLDIIQTPTLDDDQYGIALGLSNLVASIKKINLNITCITCSSPGMIELSELLNSNDAQDSVTKTMNDILDHITSLFVPASDDNNNNKKKNDYNDKNNNIGDGLGQIKIDRWLNEAAYQCPHSSKYNPNYSSDQMLQNQYQSQTSSSISNYSYSVDYLILWGSVLLVLIGVLLIVMVTIWFISRQRHKHFLEKKISNDEKYILQYIQRKDDILETTLNKTTKSLFGSNNEQVPFYIRYGMPIIIVGNIALFLSGHLNLGATVDIQMTFADETITFNNFYNFSIAKSTIDIWKAGGKELAILILIFSGIWPYTKQLITLVVWFLPPSMLSISKRGAILLWVDCLAKWSMIDIFVIVICIAAFRVSISSPDNLGFLPDNFYAIDLLVVPMWGLYSNMIAQIISQVSSHYIIYYHRQIVNKATTEAEAEDAAASEENDGDGDGDNDDKLERSNPTSLYLDQSKAVLEVKDDDGSTSRNNNKYYVLRTHTFRRPHRDNVNETLVVRNWVNYAMLFLGVILAVTVITGCILPTFSIETFGIIGIAVESGQQFEQAITNHSVISIVQMLFEEANFLNNIGDYIGITVLNCLFLCTVLIIPILQSICLILQWFLPLTTTQRTRMCVLNEILQDWQYIEVYILALFVASWQLGPVSQWLFNGYCGQLEGFFSQMVDYGILNPEDAQCFSVQGSIEPGSFTLVASAILLALLNSFVTKATRQYNYFEKRRRLQKEMEHNNEVVENSSTTSSSHQGKNNDDDTKKITASSSSSSSLSSTKLRPIPVMFTDTYRWLLCRQGSITAASATIVEVRVSSTAEGRESPLSAPL